MSVKSTCKHLNSYLSNMDAKISRRSFLKGAAAAGVSAAIGVLSTGCDNANDVPIAEELKPSKEESKEFLQKI